VHPYPESWETRKVIGLYQISDLHIRVFLADLYSDGWICAWINSGYEVMRCGKVWGLLELLTCDNAMRNEKV
jgi:hypothetical protein